MKLVTYLAQDHQQRTGVLTADMQLVLDLGDAFARLKLDTARVATMLALIQGGHASLDLVRQAMQDTDPAEHPELFHRLDSVRLCSPVPRPEQIRDFLCFEGHVKQCRATKFKRTLGDAPDAQEQFDAFVRNGGLDIVPVWYERPIYYKANRFSVIGTGQDIEWPSYSDLLDYELEFGIFIGKGGKNISRQNAHEHIFGYCIFNDVSARDTQVHEAAAQIGPSKGKDFDTGNVIGPWIVTADEIPDPYNLTMVARINGEEWSRGHSSGMAHRFEDMIACVSEEETIHPGEFFGSGTVTNGCGLELDRWIRPGDTIELEVEGIGVLRNRIVRK